MKKEIIKGDVKKYIPVNAKITLAPNDGVYGGKGYDSRIEDVDKNGVYIAVPTDKGVPIGLSKGAKLSVFSNVSGGRVSFESRVLDKREGRVPTIKISIPKEVYREQLRSFFRVDTYIKVLAYPFDLETLKRLEKHGEAGGLPAVVKDISGGGGRISLQIPTGDNETIVLDFRNSSQPDFGLIECKTLRTTSGDSRYDTSLSFTGITERQREQIVRYVFKRQIELKNMGGA